MRRITISVEDDLADAFDQLVAVKAYVNRSEAFRDLVRKALDEAVMETTIPRPIVSPPSVMSTTITNANSLVV